MRTSKISRDTAKLFERTASSTSPPRRTTRSLAAKYGYSSTTTSGLGESLHAVDIEDAVAPPAKKRKMGEKSVKLEEKVIPKKEEEREEEILIKTEIQTTRRARKPARKTTDSSTGETTVSPPSSWEAMYDAVRKMRAPGGIAYGAAVDTMGCERLADRSASPRDQRFHALIALMLSSQTKDTVNAVVMKKLQTELPAYKPGAPVGLNLDNILAVEPRLLNEMIWAVGFHNNKTKYIKQAAEILRDDWGGDIPDTIQGLTSLPGVGPKMAYLCMSVAWNRTEGIGVDVHVHRITNMWGWHKTKSPEETRLALQSWLPRDRWREINGLLVGLGQAVCLPVGRRCGDCELGLSGMCKAADRKKVLEGRKLKKEEDVMMKVEEDEEEKVLEVRKLKKEEDTMMKVEEEEEEEIKIKAEIKTEDAKISTITTVTFQKEEEGFQEKYTVKQEDDDEGDTSAVLEEKIPVPILTETSGLGPP